MPRFINQDSYLGEIVTPPSLHRYLYAFGNPTYYIDLLGYASECSWCEWFNPYGGGIIAEATGDGLEKISEIAGEASKNTQKLVEEHGLHDTSGPYPTPSLWFYLHAGVKTVEKHPEVVVLPVAKILSRGKSPTGKYKQKNTSDIDNKTNKSVEDAQKKSQQSSQPVVIIEGQPSTGNTPTPIYKSELNTSSNKKIDWKDENASMSERARAYDDSAQGARSNLETKNSQAPQVYRTLESGKKKAVRFDGAEGNILIDRKVSVVTTEKAKNQAVRQSQALEENGLTGRWEVTKESEAKRARKIFDEKNITNIKVRVVNETTQ